MKNLLRLLTLLFAAAMIQACQPDTIDVVNEEIAPNVPSGDIYTMPSDVLVDHHTDSTNAGNSWFVYKNWTYAGLNLLVWHTVVSVHNAVPFAAFARALNETPTFIGNATFQWAYNYQAPANQGGKTYGVVLTGKYINNGDDVEWIMTVSEVGGFSNFVWYTGITATDDTEANFTLYKDPANPQAYVNIEFDHDLNSNDASLRYTNVDPNSNDFGGYIEYREDSGQNFNRAFDVQAGVNSNKGLMEIEWVEPSGEGRVRHPHHFNDSQWHCWDVNKVDTDC